MKKMEMLACAMFIGAASLGAYTLMNKSTKNKADKLINNLLDKATDMSNNMMNK